MKQINALDPDRFDRTVLISVHDGTAPTLEAAEADHAATGVILVAGERVCTSTNGQAALLTAVTTAVRAFGNVEVVVGDPMPPSAPAQVRASTSAKPSKPRAPASSPMKMPQEPAVRGQPSSSAAPPPRSDRPTAPQPLERNGRVGSPLSSRR